VLNFLVIGERFCCDFSSVVADSETATTEVMMSLHVRFEQTGFSHF